MNFKSFKVAGLFGRFDHELRFRSEERIIIMIGPNGFGKTMILRMIDTFFNQPLARLVGMPFRKVEIAFDDGSVMVAEKELSGNRPPEEDTEGLEFELLSFPEDRENYGEEFKHFEHGSIDDLDDTSSKVPKWLQDIRESIEVKFIDTERLTRSPRREGYSTQRVIRQLLSGQSEGVQILPKHSTNSSERAVHHYSEQLAKRVQETLTEYGSVSQSLDRTFPRRFLAEHEGSDYSVDDFVDDLKEIESNRSDLVEAGLIAHEEQPLEIPDEMSVSGPSLQILAIYAQDAKKKLSVFDDLYKRVRAFLRIANSRFLHKRVRVGPNGLSVVDTDYLELDLETLSSGEQHELVILYELLFRIPDNSLILIDEPELSLHVQWQAQFLEDIQEMATLSNFWAILATHSPEIIGDRWDLAVQLKGPGE